MERIYKNKKNVEVLHNSSTLPFYCKSKAGLYYYKVFSKTRAIQICICNCSYEIKEVHIDLAFHNGCNEIKESEYADIFLKIYTNLASK